MQDTAVRSATDGPDRSAAPGAAPPVDDHRFGAGRFLVLTYRWARRDFEVLHRRSALRSAWAVLSPALSVALVVFMFGVVFGVNSGDVPYVSFVLAGMVAYRFALSAVNGARSLIDSRAILPNVYFPRAVIPLSRVGAEVPGLVVGLVGLVVVAAFQGRPPTPRLLAAPLSLLVLVLSTAAFAVLFATFTTFIRDMQFGLPFVAQGLFLASMISYTADRLPSWLAWLPDVNPLAAAIDGLRASFIDGTWPQWGVLVAQTVVCAALLAFAIWHLRQIEHRIVDEA